MLTREEPEPEVRPPPVLAVVMPAPEAIVGAPQQRAQVHSETRCGTVWIDARMRGLRSSGRRSTESDEATFRRVQGTHGRAHAA